MRDETQRVALDPQDDGIERLAQPGLYGEKVAAVEVIDDGRVRFRLKEPWPDFMTFYGTSATGAGWIVPKTYVERVGADGFKAAPVGAGPYKVVSFKPGVEIVLEAFDGYWRKRPAVKRLVLRSVPEEASRFAALRSGDVDIAFNLRGPLAESTKTTRGLRLDSVLLNSVFWLDLPDQWDPASPWHDRRVRLAAGMAIDRKLISQAEYLGVAQPTGSIIPRKFEFALPVAPPPYDPEQAKKLLAEVPPASRSRTERKRPVLITVRLSASALACAAAAGRSLDGEAPGRGALAGSRQEGAVLVRPRAQEGAAEARRA